MASPQMTSPQVAPQVESQENPQVDLQVDSDRSKGWVRRFWPVISGRKRVMIIALIGSMLANAIQVAGPYVLALAIDNALITHKGSLLAYGIVLFLLAVARFGVGYMYRFMLLKNAYDIEYDLRTTIYRHLTNLSKSFYDRTSSGQLVARANSDVRVIQMLLAFGPNILSQLVLFIFALIVMMTMSPMLSLVVVVTMPLVLLAGRKMRSKMLPSSWLVQARRADITSMSGENTEGVRVIKAYAREEQQVGLMSRLSRRLQWATVYQVDIQARWAPLAQNIPRFGLLGVLLYGGWLVIHGTLPVGDLVAFSAYVVMLQAPFQMLGVLLVQFQRASASAGRILELLDEHPEIYDSPGAVDLVNPKGHVEFDAVSFQYPARPLLIDGFSLTMEPGDTVAITGMTGCGKSTVVQLLARFYDVSDGSIRIDGMDIRNIKLDSLRKCVGIVGDDPFLFTASLAENISYANPDVSTDQIWQVAAQAGLSSLIEELPQGLDTVVGERGYTLSGGERQRVAIARMLIADPNIIVFDDATSAVDVETEAALHEGISAIRGGKTILLIAHRLSTVLLADRVAYMESGRIVASGSHEELLERIPNYRRIFSVDHVAGSTIGMGNGVPNSQGYDNASGHSAASENNAASGSSTTSESNTGSESSATSGSSTGSEENTRISGNVRSMTPGSHFSEEGN